MRLYKMLKPMIVYTDKGFLLPKGEKTGFGNSVFLLSPTKNCGYTILTDGFLNYKTGLYKHYMIDFIYKEKLGYRKYVKNNTGAFKKEFSEREFPTPLKLVTNANKIPILKRNVNLLINLGEWNDLFFQFQIKTSLERICKNYWNFISNKINDDTLENYNKIIYINIDQWINSNKKLTLNKKGLDNPISIFLVSAYKFQDALISLRNCDFIFVSPSSGKVMKIPGDIVNKKTYPRVKQKILSMIDTKCVDAENIDDSVMDITSNEDEIKEITGNKILTKEDEVRSKILAGLTKNLLGEYDDITSNFDEDDDSEINTDDDKINEIKNLGSKYIDEHPELLKDDSIIDASIKEVTDEVKKNYYVKEYTPKYTDTQLENIHKLTDIQTSKIGNMNETITNLESKIIDESDYSDIVSTNNPDLIKSKFANFDKSYNNKKLEKDIDNAIGMLSTASKKVFIVDKQEEDSSTPLDLKKTLIYTLEDEDGREMTIKFDVPIIYDDHYMMIKGNKKVIQHMLILKPLVKTGKDAVQIVSNYQKMFILRKGMVDLKTNAFLKFIKANSEEFDTVTGNAMVVNKKYKTTLEFDQISKKIIQYKINDFLFIMNINKLKDYMDKNHIKYDNIDESKNVLIGVDMHAKQPIILDINESYIDKVMSLIPIDYVEEIKKIGRKSNGNASLMYSKTKPLQKELPLILLLLYFEGFDTVMEKAKIEYELIPKSDEKLDIDLYEWGLTELSDGYIKWKRYPTENSLLMNGLNHLPMELYTMKDLNSKDTYMYLLTNIYKYANQSFNLDQYYDFMIDPITKEILIDMKLPTDLVSLLILANKMLKTSDSSNESDLNNMRLRSNEVISRYVYKTITDSYRDYRRTLHRRKPLKVSVNKDAVINKMMSADASVITDASSLNPVFEVSSLRKVTYKGEEGTNMDHAFNLKLRAYNETMLGVMGITSSPDGNVGINRLLTLEPNITSTRGYIDVAGKKNVEELNSANLLTPSELLTPLGVQHDDPARTAMAYKQSVALVMVDDSDPVLIGNGAEKILPYHLSSDFTVVAEDDGEIVEVTKDFVVIKYKNGKYRSIDLSIHIEKNAAAGFYIENQLTCNKKVGDKVKKNEVVAWNDKAFSKNGNNPEVSMRLGPLVKVAIIPEWDIYEDSAPITRAASEKMATTMVMPISVSLSKDTFIYKMLNIGDKVNAGEMVIAFDDQHEDESVISLFNEMRKDWSPDQFNEFVEMNSQTKKSHYTGTIIDIDIISTVELDALSESLREVVSSYWKKLKKRENVLNKYKNEGDMNFYKSGNVITKTASPVQTDYRGKIRGTKVDDGVVITFYVAFKDTMSRGDKLTAEFALKSVNSHVIEKGLEPYSEFRPDESIDLITAPLSISARKTPSIFIAMFANKLLIEAKRHLNDYWKE